jgi:hypothetical protein
MSTDNNINLTPEQEAREQAREQAHAFMASVLAPTGRSKAGKKAWSIDVETTWVPFFTAGRVLKDKKGRPLCDLPDDVLGAPIRLAVDKQGAVKFGANGRPVTRLAAELKEQIDIARDNYIVSLQALTAVAMEESPEEYREVVARQQAAAVPVFEREAEMVAEAERMQLISEAAARAAEAAAAAFAERHSQTEPVQDQVEQPALDATPETPAPADEPKRERRQPVAAK